MKKVIPGVILLVAVAVAAAFLLFKKAPVHHTPAVELAPAETLFFVHFPDVKRTTARWPKTGLAQIAAEPEVQAFLAKPRANAPQMKMLEEKLSQIDKLDPGEGFLAVTSIDGSAPHFIAGLSFAGSKADAEALLAEPRAELKKAYPAGKSDVTMQGQTQIETFTYEDTTIGEAIQAGWYLVSNDMELLRHTLDVPAQGLGQKALASNDLYKKSTSHLPGDGEVVLFAQVGVLTERLVSLLVASGQTLDPKQIADLKKIQAVAFGTKFEGEQMRDTLFLLSSGSTTEAPLARNSLAFTSPGTFLSYMTTVPATIEIPESSLVLGAMLPGFSAVEKGLADKGLKWSDFGKAFGPEFGVVGNWVEHAAQPSVLLALDVRDAAKARSFVEVFTGGLAGSAAWGSKEEHGTTIFQSPAAGGLVPIAPTVALTDKFLVVGFSEPDIVAALAQLKTGKAAITAVPAFGQMAKSVGTPTAGFGYLDMKALFEHSYGVLHPFLAMSLAFNPESAKYVDAGKLPKAEVIGKHLTPSIYSQSVTSEGTLVESVGTLTFNQVLVGTVGGALIAAYPMIESTLGSGFKLDPNTFQLTPPKVPDPQDLPKRDPQDLQKPDPQNRPKEESGAEPKGDSAQPSKPGTENQQKGDSPEKPKRENLEKPAGEAGNAPTPNPPSLKPESSQNSVPQAPQL